MDDVAIITKLTKTPRIVLDAARNGSFSSLMELANHWDRVPELLDMGVLEVFYGHLEPNEVPDLEAPESLACNHACASLWGLARLGTFEDDKAGRQAAERLLKSWPGIFKWASYIFAVEVKSTAQTPENRRSKMQILSGMLYAICEEESVRPAVLATPGALEMAASIWFFEDQIPASAGKETTLCTKALASLLREGDMDDLDRAMAACGGKSDAMAKLVMKHIKTEMQRPAIDSVRVMSFMELLHKFSFPEHPLQHACLVQGAMGTVTRGLLAYIAQTATLQTTSHLKVIWGCFLFIESSLQANCSNGFMWVSEAVKAGLLLAFVNASPHYSTMDPFPWEGILRIIGFLVPRCLVYRTVTNNVHAALAVAQASPYMASVFQSPAKDAWEAFVRVANDRKAVERQSIALRVQSLVCDNAKCLKAAQRAQFRKCSACETVNYCSKECQRIAWKEGGHKTICQLKQQERIGGKATPVSKTDASFIGKLSRHDVSRNLAHIKTKAASTHPGIPIDALVVRIDYRCHPETYNVALFAGYDHPSPSREPEQTALLDLVRGDPGRYTMFEVTVPYGYHGAVLVCSGSNLWAPPPDTLRGGCMAIDEGGLSAEVD